MGWLVGRPLIAGMVALFTCAGSAFSVPCESSTAVAAAYNLKAYPLASFVWFPAFPRVGESISLVSTSTDLTSPITGYAWDLADNGPFGVFNASGPVTTTTFATPASHQARLRVTAADHLSSIAVETIHMSTPPPGVFEKADSVSQSRRGRSLSARFASTWSESVSTDLRLAISSSSSAFVTSPTPCL